MSKVYRNKEDGNLWAVIQEIDGKVMIAPPGGGMGYKIDKDRFFNENEEVDEEETYKLRYRLIGAEWMEAKFMAYSPEMKWNGWATPWFTREQINEIIKLMPNLRLEGNSVMYDDPDYPEDGPQEFEFELKDTEHGKIELCPLGDGWCWTEYNFEEQ